MIEGARLRAMADAARARGQPCAALYARAAEHFDLETTPGLREPARRLAAVCRAAAPDDAAAPAAVPEGATLDAVVGGAEVKRALVQAIQFPRLFPEMFRNGVSPCRTILLYGPPGTGKTMLARAAAVTYRLHLHVLDAAEAMQKYMGESEKAVRAVFEAARQHPPALIFIDEADVILAETSDESGTTGRLRGQFQTEVDGIASDLDGIVLMAATNYPWRLSAAMLRRFRKQIYVPLPDDAARRAMLEAAFGPLDGLGELVARTRGRSGADLALLADQVAEARMWAMFAQMRPGAAAAAPPPVTAADVLAALAAIRPAAPEDPRYAEYNSRK